MRYVDRVHAGRTIAPDVAAVLAGDDARPLILGVPRGGVVVAAEVARFLRADLDLALARKIGAPSNRELAIGAVGETGEPFLNRRLIEHLHIGTEYLEAAVARAKAELRAAATRYRRGRERPSLAGRSVVVIDDGVATGATLRATIRALSLERPHRLVCAVPVAPPESAQAIADEVDDFVCPSQPRRFRAVGEWYNHFGQTSDREVLYELDRLWEGSGGDHLGDTVA